MQDQIRVWLEDMERAIFEINHFLPESMSFIKFG